MDHATPPVQDFAVAEAARVGPPSEAALQRPAAEQCLSQILTFVATVGVRGVTSSLTREAMARALAARADATLEALAFDLECFSRFCVSIGSKGLPASDETVARYIERLSRIGIVPVPNLAGKGGKTPTPLKPASIARRLASIGMVHQLVKLPNPCEEANVRNAMRIARRALGSRQRQAAPVRLESAECGEEVLPKRFTLAVLLEACDDSLAGLRDAALISTAYDGGFRVSELTGLTLGALSECENGQGEVQLSRSKTDQEGEGVSVRLSADTMRRLRHWIEAAGLSEGDKPVFRRIKAIVRKGSKGRPARRYADLAPNAGFSATVLRAIPPRATEVWREVGEGGLSRSGVLAIYRKVGLRAADFGLVDLAGEELVAAIKGLSTHSMRVGLTLDLFRQDLDALQVMEALRWKDPKTALRYARNRPSGERRVAEVLALVRS
jgi:integrase